MSAVTDREQVRAAQGPDASWHGLRPWVLAGTALVLVAAGVVLAMTNPLASHGSVTGGVRDNAYPTSLANVTRQSLSSTMPETATLGYTGAYTVINRVSGTYTWLPAPGQVIGQGQVLYRVDGNPIVLLYGSMPAYRSLSPGSRGADIRQLNADLVALGFAHASVLRRASDSFGPATSTALKKLQAHLGMPQTGTLDLGQAVFLPAAIRVASVSSDEGVTLGAPTCSGPPECGGQPVLTATSTVRQVTIDLDASEQSYVKVGDRVSITLPSNSTTPGVVSSVSKVATVASSSASSGSGGSAPTVTVEVSPTDPAATGTLDHAPVEVAITTATVHNALTVPVDALLARVGGRYAVEVVNPHGVHRLVDVRPGIFDDADGLVQVSGSGLAAGQRVVVPGT
jgi:peptidoglycan hydrolase-like protein with peptidoglycan-binding domain